MTRNLVAAVLLSATAPTHAAIDIVFDYSAESNGFFSSQVRRNALDAAAAAFESRIGDTLAPITPGTGPNTYTLSATNPSGGAPVTLVNQPIGAGEIRIFVGASPISSLGLGSSQFSVNGTNDFIQMVVSRGEPGVLASPQTDFAPWGGSIAFNAGINWHDDASVPVASDRFDLYSVAVHEIAHLMGIGQSPSFDAQRTGLLFNGLNASTLFGGAVPLADETHFASSVRSPIDGLGSFETALDPEIQNGLRKSMTDLDWAALRDVGWEVSPIPEPETWALMLGGLSLVLAMARRRRSSQA